MEFIEGLDVWERQPGETNKQWEAWQKYRSYYPTTPPSYRELERETGLKIREYALKWDWPARLESYGKHVDSELLEQKKAAIINMNMKHIDMAAKVQAKLDKAIDNLDPLTMKPGEIKGLMQLATELERKARIDDVNLVEPEAEVINKPPKQADMRSIVEILQKTGMFGIKQTTEVVVKHE